MMTPDLFEPHLFAVRDGELAPGGIPVSRLAGQAGGTPFFAYDGALIGARVAQTRQALPRQVHLHYAVKANPFPPLLALMAGLVDGFDVASAGEMERALATGMRADHVGFAGPGKREGELRAAVAAGVTVNCESQREITALAAASAHAGRRARVSVRVNPPFEMRSSGMRMGGGAKPFGIDAEMVPAALEHIGRLDLDFQGFHIYTGSQSLRADALVDGLRKSFTLVKELARHAPSAVRSVNLGGGFGIPYFAREKRLDLLPVGEALADIAADAAANLGTAALILELGRYLVGEAGIYVTRIVDRKISRGQTFLVTDGGMNHHLAASGNFGQVLRKNYPVAIANAMEQPVASAPVTIVGPLCTPLDVLADGVSLPDAQPGDLVAVFQSGAYGASASPHGFLGHPPPGEILV